MSIRRFHVIPFLLEVVDLYVEVEQESNNIPLLENFNKIGKASRDIQDNVYFY